MIKIENVMKDGKEGITCIIEGSVSDISLDIMSLFKGLSQNEILKMTLLVCIESFLKSNVNEILKKKGE